MTLRVADTDRIRTMFTKPATFRQFAGRLDQQFFGTRDLPGPPGQFQGRNRAFFSLSGR